jgi:hypothetical protein
MEKIKDNLFPLVLSVLIVLITIISYNFTVTFDGYLYLNSANYLFEKNFILEYQWLREPGYPFFLKTIGSIYKIDFVYVFAHSILLSLSFFLNYKIFFKKDLSLFSKLLIIVIILNPYYLTWASTILQVAPILFCLTLVSFMISRTVEEIKRIDVIYWTLVNIFSASIALQIGLISFICCLVIFIMNSIQKQGKAKEILVITIIFLVTSLSWLEYKSHVLEDTKAVQSGWNTDYISSSTQLLLPIDKKLFSTAVEHSILLTGINQLGERETESLGLVNTVFNGGSVCGVWFPTDFTYAANVIQNSIETTCSSSLINLLLSKLNSIGFLLWQISSLFVWLSFVWIIFLFKSPKSFIVLPAYLLLISYSFLIFTIDRYILPTYIFGLFMFVSLIEFFIYKFYTYMKRAL